MVSLRYLLSFGGYHKDSNKEDEMLLDDDRELTDEQRMMRDTCRAFVDEHVIPFTRRHWQREWIMTPEERLPNKILEIASEIGIRTLGIPEEFGGIQLDPK